MVVERVNADGGDPTRGRWANEGEGRVRRVGSLRREEDLFLIAFSQEIDVGLKLPDSQGDSGRDSFAGF